MLEELENHGALPHVKELWDYFARIVSVSKFTLFILVMSSYFILVRRVKSFNPKGYITRFNVAFHVLKFNVELLVLNLVEFHVLKIILHGSMNKYTIGLSKLVE